MTEKQSRKAQAPAAPGNTAVLDAAHLGDIRGAFGTIGEHDTNRPRQLAAPSPRARSDHGSRPHRHGRRQRRRRGRDVRASGSELRHEPAVDARLSHPGVDRQPGDGGPPRRGHRRRTRQVDLRAFWTFLGMVLRRRSLHPQLPHHRHGVHRHLARRAVLRGDVRTSQCRLPGSCSSASLSPAVSRRGNG